MSQRNLNQCNEPGNIKDLNIDPIPPYCDDGSIPSLRDVASPVDLSWIEERMLKKTGLGESALCDPIQAGHIINEQGMESPQRSAVYRYSQALKGCNEAVKNLFSDLVVLDEQGKAWPVPIIWGSQEKAVAWFLQENTRKDNSLVVDRIKLPIMAIYSSGLDFNQDRYIYHKAIDYLRRADNNWKPGFTKKEHIHERDTVFGVSRGIPIDKEFTLYIWTSYEIDMDQIIEQILLKFSPIAYIRVRGVTWEIGVRLNSVRNNTELEPGDQAIRVIKSEVSMTVESFIPQPLTRKKAVLKTRVDIVDSIDNSEISQLLARLDTAVKELE
jgi:hypothetical protein